MRRLLLAALLLGSPVPASADPVAVAATSCAATVATGSCQFTCVSDDADTSTLAIGRLAVTVYGAGAVQGSASCGGGSAHCSGTGTCAGAGTATRTATGWCDLTQGQVAICSAS